MSPEPSDRHPDDLDLDAARTNDAPSEVSAHVASCPECQESLTALRELGERLSARPAPIDVPAAREKEILGRAAAAAGRARRRRALRLAVIPAVAAAALLVVVLLADRSSSTPAAREPQRVALPVGDVNQDQMLDILDAFALARSIEAGEPTRPDWDFNHDQVIDALDVDWLAQLAVSVSAKLQGGPL